MPARSSLDLRCNPFRLAILLALLCAVPLRASADEPVVSNPSIITEAFSTAEEGAPVRRRPSLRVLLALGTGSLFGGALCLASVSLAGLGGHGSTTDSTSEVLLGAGAFLLIGGTIMVGAGVAGIRGESRRTGATRNVALGLDLALQSNYRMVPTLTLRF